MRLHEELHRLPQVPAPFACDQTGVGKADETGTNGFTRQPYKVSREGGDSDGWCEWVRGCRQGLRTLPVAGDEESTLTPHLCGLPYLCRGHL